MIMIGCEAWRILDILPSLVLGISESELSTLAKYHIIGQNEWPKKDWMPHGVDGQKAKRRNLHRRNMTFFTSKNLQKT